MTSGSDWLDQARRLLDAFVQGQAASSTAPAGGRAPGAKHADCTWCPLCQAAAVVRGERPEVAAALADVLTATAATLRAFAEQPTADEPATAEDTPVAEPPPAVQRIEIA